MAAAAILFLMDSSKKLTLAMSKIWAAVSVQCQAFLMKNDFLDSE